jgi:hypothetical protein
MIKAFALIALVGTAICFAGPVIAMSIMAWRAL